MSCMIEYINVSKVDAFENAHCKVILRIMFTQGLRFQKVFLQNSITEVKSFKNTKNNVINKYRYCYSYFVCLRKICNDKGELH